MALSRGTKTAIVIIVFIVILAITAVVIWFYIYAYPSYKLNSTVQANGNLYAPGIPPPRGSITSTTSMTTSSSLSSTTSDASTSDATVVGVSPSSNINNTHAYNTQYPINKNNTINPGNQQGISSTIGSS